MLKKIIGHVKNLVEQNKDTKEDVKISKLDDIDREEKDYPINLEVINTEHSITPNKVNIIECREIKKCEIEQLLKEDKDYIKEMKIKRGESIKAIDIYTKEEQFFKNHKECSKKLEIPLEYIKENLKYGYTDYLGEAIKYLSEELNLPKEYNVNYLESRKAPSQIFSSLNDKIFKAKISEYKRNEILCSEKIEPIKMYYTFECIDEEYDDYFIKYKSIIKRGGKKKIELVDKKGEVIEIFKSLDECSVFLNKEKNEIVDMLKYKRTKVGRNEIRYSLRNI